MALKFRRGTAPLKSGSLAFGEPYVNTTLGTLQIGGDAGDITLSAVGTGSNLVVGGISGSSLDITGNAKIDGDLTLGGKITIGDASSDTVNVVASLSSSLIPSITNTFDLGSTDKVWKDLYISTGSIKFVDGNTVVNTLSSDTLTQILENTGSVDSQISELYSTASNHEQRITANESISSSYAKTNISNTFSNDQIISGNVHLTGRVTAGLAVSASGLNVNKADGQVVIQLANSTNGRGFDLHSYNGDSFAIHGTNGLNVFRIDSGSQYDTHLFGNLYVASGSVFSMDGFSGPIKATNGVVSGSSQVSGILSSLNSYTSSLNNAIELTGSTVSFLGNIVVYGTQSVINSENLAINDNLIYLNEGSTITNPDLGIVGNYNDGVYGHSGIFRDASDGGAWKVFKGLTTEPSGTIDTSNAGFALADFKAAVITGTSFNGSINATNGVVSGSSQIIDILSSLNTYTGSNDTTNTTQNNRLTALEVSASTALSTNNTQDTSITNLNSFTSSINTTIKNKLNTDTVISGSSQVQLGSASGNITLSTQTTGDYVASLVGGTGVTISNNSGEGATPTIAIGQSVATSASPTFAGLTINGAITATGDITAYYTSDKRHKNNIQTIPNALQKVSKLNGVTWEWNDDVNEVTKSTPKTGLIAQEVQSVLPEVVKEREDGFLSLDYSKMMGLLVEAIKEQQTHIHNLTLQIEELKKQKGL